MNGRPTAAQVHNAAVNCIFSGMSFFPAARGRRRRLPSPPRPHRGGGLPATARYAFHGEGGIDRETFFLL